MAPRRSAHPRQSRQNVTSYHEDSSSDESHHSQKAAGSVSLRPRARSFGRYREQSTDEEFAALDSDHEDPVGSDGTRLEPAPNSVAPNHVVTAGRESRNSHATRSATGATSKKRSVGKSKTPKQNVKKRPRVSIEEPIPIDPATIPPWQTLPYQILFDIFLRAFHSFNDSRSAKAKSASTLLNIARLCRAFHEPAMTALYYSPSLSSAYKGHGLLNLLSTPVESLSMNYAGKIRELHIDAETVLTLKSGPTLGYFNLDQLIRNTPRLHTLKLYHQDDIILGIPHWNLGPSKWSYPESLFATLDESGIRLRSWEWNGRFLDIDDLLEFMLRQHLRPAFQTIKELRLVHLADSERVEASDRETALAAALHALPNIERLEFVECSMVANTTLVQLPLTVRAVTICNCDRPFSRHIQEMLQTHGEQLRELCLDHNRHMNMSFMPSLGKYCPKLEKFRMDLSMHDWSSYHDFEPHFSDLIKVNQCPTWPEKLQDLELFHLRHWTAEAAEMFFNSLVLSAPQMKDLRRLEITAMLEIGWRDRARFRERWMDRFERVFLRRKTSPNPNLRSLQKRPLASVVDSSNTGDSERPASNGSDTRHSSTRHSRRIAELHEPEVPRTQDTDSDSSPEEPRQGMCDHVTIRIDNQRPNETQFNENDFLDDEASGDEDWDGDDYDAGGAHAW